MCYIYYNYNYNNNNYSNNDNDGVVYNKDKTSIICYPAGIHSTSFEIISSVTRIGEGAFYKCNGLEGINIPSNVTIVDVDGFRECVGLTSLVIGSVDTQLFDDSFFGCTNLIDIKATCNQLLTIYDGNNYNSVDKTGFKPFQVKLVLVDYVLVIFNQLVLDYNPNTVIYDNAFIYIYNLISGNG